MNLIAGNISKIKAELNEHVKLVAVSKFKAAEQILKAYVTGHRIFGENYVQELCTKYYELPKDIEWHFIGHLQSNKVKYIAPFVNLIHAVDSISLLKEINKQAQKHNRIIPCLLQVHISQESTKEGLNKLELYEILPLLNDLPNVHIKGLMGMASFTTDQEIIKNEFIGLKEMYDKLKEENFDMSILSMGMSSDYKLAITCGSNLIRLGTSIFGSR